MSPVIEEGQGDDQCVVLRLPRGAAVWDLRRFTSWALSAIGQSRFGLASSELEYGP